MNVIQKTLAATGVAATIALSVLGAVPASAQTWHHHYRWHHRHHHYTVVRPIIVHRYSVHHYHPISLHHYPVHHIGTTVTKTVTHNGHKTVVKKTVVQHP